MMLAACSKQPAASTQSAQPGAPATGGSAGVAAASASPAANPSGQVTGPVVETMNAASYTYVRVKTDSGDVWAAAPQFPVKVGERVTVPLEMPMKDFHSQAFNRDSPLIYFVSRIGREGDPNPPAADAPTMMSGHGTSASTAATPCGPTEPIAQPAGVTTIADVWAKRKALAGKTVTVHGRVMKFNAGILGKNWIHLQDGTGKPADNTNDITVMAGEDVNVRVGDTVSLSGTVILDKDFGAGYAYATAIDNARLVK